MLFLVQKPLKSPLKSPKSVVFLKFRFFAPILIRLFDLELLCVVDLEFISQSILDIIESAYDLFSFVFIKFSKSFLPYIKLFNKFLDEEFVPSASTFSYSFNSNFLAALLPIFYQIITLISIKLF